MMRKYFSKIREIRKNDAGGQYQFKIIPVSDKEMRIVAEFVDSLNRYSGSMVNFPVPNRRVIKLAQDILKFFDRKAEWEKWEPTFGDIEERLDEKYGDDGLYMWIIEKCRYDPKLGKRVYEWLDHWEKDCGGIVI